MTTWAQPIRHPWFNPPSTKRRQSASDDDDDVNDLLSSDTLSRRRRKRLRFSSLEHTLAHMTLGNTVASEDVDMWPRSSSPRPRMQDIVLPSSIEEPGTPGSEPVEMDIEPTAVSLPSDRNYTDSDQLEIREVHIPSAVLERIKKQIQCPPPLVPLPPRTSQALVLYRTPRPASPDLVEDEPTRTSVVVAHEDDVMEVE